MGLLCESYGLPSTQGPDGPSSWLTDPPPQFSVQSWEHPSHLQTSQGTGPPGPPVGDGKHHTPQGPFTLDPWAQTEDR